MPESSAWEPDKLRHLFHQKRAVVFGATGSCGGGFARALVDVGCEVTVALRRDPEPGEFPAGCKTLVGPLNDDAFLAHALGSSPDFVMSGLASRSGLPKSAWELYDLHCRLFDAAKAAGVGCVVVVTSFCGAIACDLPIHQPLLNTERALIDMAAGGRDGHPDYLIIRPTSFYENFLRKAVPDMLAGKSVSVIVPPGGPLRHMFLAAEDVGRFAVAKLAEGARNATLQVGGTRARTYEEAVKEIARAAGKQVSFKRTSLACFNRLIDFMACLDWLKGTDVAHYLKFARYFNVVPMQCSVAFSTVPLGRWALEQLPRAGGHGKRMAYNK